MSNANPSGLGYAVSQTGAQPERHIAANEMIVQRYDGVVVKRITMTNGDTKDTQVFAGDYPNPTHEATLAAEKTETPKKPVKVAKGES